MLDLLVIGAGLTGLSAALAAAEAGHSVRVIAKGMGALHWTSGALDLLGYFPNQPLAVDDPLGALESLSAEHPYRLLGKERVGKGLERFYGWLRAAGSPWYGADTTGRNMLLPTAVGAVRPVFLAPAAQKAGEILPGASGGAPMVIVGVDGLRDFYPALIAENLNKQGYRARAASIPWQAASEMRDRNPMQLAVGIEEPAQRKKLVDALKRIAQPGERLGFPAILGVDGHAELMRELADALNTTIFEIPMLPPSVPGIRLHRTLVQLLQAKGVRVETNMEVIGFHAEGAQIRWVETATAARPLRHEAHHFLLATGGILGGGFVGSEDGIVRETVFGLPLTVPHGREHWFRPRFFDEMGQPVYKGGVRVNENFQPLGEDGAPIYANLRAAGGLLDGADALLEHSLEGIAITTAIAAVTSLTQRRRGAE